MEINLSPTIWFTGLSASGKTTLSTQLYEELKSIGVDNIVLLDGESIRDQMKNYDFDNSSREEIAYQKAKISQKLNEEGNIVLISGITHKASSRLNNRNSIQHYYEVYLKCDVDVCAKRDYKNQYIRAFAGEYDNFIGVTEQYEESDMADFILYTGLNSLDECSLLLLKNIKTLLRIR
jgi:adenylylsulfate kinase-like enzyme